MRNFSLEEMKDIVNTIVKSEKEKYNIEFNHYYINTFEHAKMILKDKHVKLKHRIHQITLPINSKGLSNNLGIFIFDKGEFSTYNKHNQWDFIDVINTTFHEIRHKVQTKRGEYFNDYELFLIDYCNIKDFKYRINSEEHDSFFTEIDAELYARTMTLDLTKDFISDKMRNYLERSIKRLTFQKNNYDFDKHFSRFYTNYCNNPPEHPDPVITIFFDKNGFKNFKDIVSSPFYQIIDPLLKASILSSKEFLSSINYELEPSLQEELFNNIDFFIGSLEFINKINKEMFEAGDIKEEEFLTAKTKLTNRIAIRNELIFNNLNTSKRSL